MKRKYIIASIVAIGVLTLSIGVFVASKVHESEEHPIVTAAKQEVVKRGLKVDRVLVITHYGQEGYWQVAIRIKGKRHSTANTVVVSVSDSGEVIRFIGLQ